MALVEQGQEGIYALDKLLRKIGMWPGPRLENLKKEERRELYDRMVEKGDFDKPYVLARSSCDPDSGQLSSMISYVSYDPDPDMSGDRKWIHKLIYWRHMPWADGEQTEEEDVQVVELRGLANPEQTGDTVPDILPEQVWWNGKQMFQGGVYGGGHNPFRPEFRRFFGRVVEVSKRCNEILRNPARSLELIGRIFEPAKEALGSAPQIRGITSDGKWDPVESTLNSLFTNAITKPGDTITLNLPAVSVDENLFDLDEERKNKRELTPLDRLKIVNGFFYSSLPNVHGMMEDWGEPSTDFDSGMPYLASALYEYDEERKRHIFRQYIMPEDPPEDMDAPEPFDMIRLEYSQDGDRFTLEDASMMDLPSGEFDDRASKLRLLGMMQDCANELAQGRYPDYRNHLFRHRLQDKFSEFGPPPGEDVGGEFKWYSMNGRSLEKKADVFGGNNVGGGQVLISRVMKTDQDDRKRISETAMIHDFPLIVSKPESDYDGLSPDVMRVLNAVRNGGAIMISHDHFDHASLQYLAKMKDEDGNGWLKGVKVVCREDIGYIIRNQMTRIGVRPEDWPEFVYYDQPGGHPDIKDMGDGQYAYCARDEDGIARIWTQICRKGSMHTAETDMHAFTGCYGDEHYHDTYVSDGDAFGIFEHGWRFLEKGQLALARLPEVTYEKLTAKIKDFNKLYIGWDEPTGVTLDGNAPRITQFEDTFRHCLRSLPEGYMVSHHSFSTNILERRVVRKICNEPETLRNVTAAGANSTIRDSCMNMFGVGPHIDDSDPDKDVVYDETDLREVDIPPELLPQSAYDAALVAANDFLKTRIAKAEKARERSKKANPPSVEELLEKDVPYLVFREILRQAEEEKKNGNSKPLALYDAFFSGNENAFEKIVDELKLPKADTTRKMPRVVRNALDNERKRLSAELINEEKDPEANTEFWMLRNLAKNGRIRFSTKCCWNERNMYDAIMREGGQETAARHGVRSSKRALNFRKDLGNLLVCATGATGSVGEQLSMLSSYAEGRSLYDHDEIARNTGYKIDSEKMILFVTQTPSMGDEARKNQERIVQDIVRNRGNTVFLSFHGGFRIINPKEHRAHFENYYRSQGWNIRWDGRNNELVVEDHHLHIKGHRSYNDMLKKMLDPRYKVKLVEAIHIPGWESLNRWTEIVLRAGRRTSIEKPDDYQAMECREDENGNPYMKVTDYLTPSYWLFKLRRKYPRQYGGYLEMLRLFIMPREGRRRMDALDVRSDGASNMFEETVAAITSGAFLKPYFKGVASAAQHYLGPDPANVRPEGDNTSVTASAMVRMARTAARLATQKTRYERRAARQERGGPDVK